MRIYVYALCFNESALLPFFIRNARLFADRVTIYDNMSTDGSRDIAASMGAEVVTFDTRGEINNDAYLDIKNHAWKKDRAAADWVVVCDMDEFLHPGSGVRAELARCALEGASIPAVNGYRMVTPPIPADGAGALLTETHRLGGFSANFCKSIVFDPRSVREINYSGGAHYCNPTGYAVGNVADPERHKFHSKRELAGCGLRLLHYCSPGWEHFLRKVLSYSARRYSTAEKANPYRAAFFATGREEYEKKNNPSRFGAVV